jgi:trimethylamine--corrinoid protein Co-methyltransferase
MNNLLSNSQLDQIHQTALKILIKVGIRVHHKEALKIFEKAGAQVDFSSETVKIPEEMVTYALKQAPSEFSMYDREMEKEYIWGDSELKLGSGGSVINILDSDNKTIRPPKTADLINMYTLTDNLPEVSWTAPGSFVTDVPQQISAIWRFYIRLKYGSKPSCADGIQLVDLADNCELLQAVRSNDDDYIKKPFAIVQPCPMSPLSWTPEGAGYLMESAKRKMPALMLAMPFAGVSAPITMAGAIAMQTVELLSGLVLLQAIQPGLPTIYGGGASHADMRDISNVMGSMEAQMMNSATMQMARFYKLPGGTAAIFGYSDSKRNDFQAGAESAFGQLLLSLGGANIAYGLGIMAGMDCNSLEKIVLDHEIFKSVKKFLSGMEVSKETLAFDVINQVGPEGDFLSNKFTFDWFKKEYDFAQIFDRKARGVWEEKGAITCQEHAREYVQTILKKSDLNRLSPSLDKDLDGIMSGILKRRGFKLEDYLNLLPE